MIGLEEKKDLEERKKPRSESRGLKSSGKRAEIEVLLG